MNALLQDLRFAIRLLTRDPAFTAVAVLTLAVALGANTAIFSVVQGVLLRPLPYGNPEGVVAVKTLNIQDGEGGDAIAFPNYLDLRGVKSFERVAAFMQSGMFLMEGDEPTLLRGIDATADLLPLLRVKPALGRFYTAEEDREGGPKVIVISDRLWKRLGSDPKIVGRTVKLGTSGSPWTVVGVMPAHFRFPAQLTDTDYWAPLVADLSEEDRTRRDLVFLQVVARLRDGAPISRAQAEIDALAQRLEKDFVSSNNGLRFPLVSVHADIVKSVRPALLILMAAVGGVLLIACANVANLLLARAANRQREISIRSAFGASRRRIVMQLLLESVVLSILAGVLGLLLAAWGVDLLIALAPADIPRLDAVKLDGTVVGFALFAALFTGILFGIAPALAASKTNLVETLKEGGRGSTEGRKRNRVRNALVVAEIALSLLLLIGAGLLIKSFVHLINIDAGFDPRNAATIDFSARGAYKSDEQLLAYQNRVLERIAAIPGVERAAASTSLPLDGGEIIYSFNIIGRDPYPPGREPNAVTMMVTPGYFETLRIPLRKGRDFLRSDHASSPRVAIINEAFAARFFPNENPIGKRLRIGDQFGEPTIIGVAGNVRYLELSEAAKPTMYMVFTQIPSRRMSFVARTRSETPAMPSLLRSAIRQVDRQQAIVSVESLEQMRAESVAARRFNMILLQTLSTIALLLAAVGIYSIMSYTVTQRTSEIGIRMALGAEGRDVLRMILKQASRLVLAGTIIGITTALIVTRLMTSFLYGVTPHDPLTFVVICVLMGGVALLASYVPARRAAEVDPLVAIRNE
jgi:putative ABC transport system permease protein